MKQVLYYKDDAGSDKMYAVEIVPEGDLFHVHFAFGRRVGTPQTGCKTSTGPVALAEAKAICAKLVNEKMAKGYLPGDDAGVIQYPEAVPKGKPSSGMTVLPQLLTAIDEPWALRLIPDDDWLMEPKFDGQRVQLHKRGDDIRGYSRTKKAVSLPASVITAGRAFSFDFVIDGELVADVFVCFDILEVGVVKMTEETCETRIRYVSTLWPMDGIGIVSSPFALTTEEKTAFYETLHSKGAEGAVFKLKSARYTSGRGLTALKRKFWDTASVIVGKRNGRKRAFFAMLTDGTNMGSVTVYPNQEFPNEGDVAEIRYLYVHDVGGKAIQSKFLAIRTDVPPSECTADQFEIKGEERD